MPRIAVDIDSTLYDFETPMRQAYLDLAMEKGDKDRYFRGGYQSWVEFRSPSDVCGLEVFNEALDRVHSDEVILSRHPYEHAPEVLQELAPCCEITYVTHRDPKTYDATSDWLSSWGFPRRFEDGGDYEWNDLMITGSNKAAELQDFRYIIDDRPKALVQFVYDHVWRLQGKLSRKGFGLLYEHNRALTDVPDIYLAPTWLGLRYYLEEKGVLYGSAVATG